MKRILLMLACAATIFTACTDDGKKRQETLLAQQRDSLNKIIAQKDNEIDDMMSTLNDIEEGFREINEAQGRVTLAKNGEGAGAEARIKENMQFIQTTMKQNRELINKLRQQARESSVNGEQLKRAIENLTTQLEQKDLELRQLRAELEAKNIHIAQQEEAIASLNDNVNQLRDEGEKKDNTISKQDKQIHEAWFVFGTKKELKEQNILTDGKVLEQNFNKNYFTKIDIRVEKEIKLYSRDAKVLTAHPQSSYTLTRDANKQYVLRIVNPEQFWSTSKYLVVLVK